MFLTPPWLPYSSLSSQGARDGVRFASVASLYPFAGERHMAGGVALKLSVRPSRLGQWYPRARGFTAVPSWGSKEGIESGGGGGGGEGGGRRDQTVND
ncbi:hypothetical protein GALMADRAFT_883564 [Galerina marginata CBS 339.88]|uniref:Uncharacterized protein n=1 Tax=Galerina marginata (strain CBS 339.88) TaxID=685588 RepID=A0A067SHD8_GALM3|nr:hypothetical protein GALMADRAFT_883564 [Galerina marginata CBS 339.88]